MKNIFGFMLAGAALPLLIQTSARAEGSVTRGNGEFGINRRVATNPEYSQVSGSATITFGPDDTLGQHNWFAYRDSPSFYLGKHGGTEADAGFQYDLNPAPPPNQAGTSVLPDDGWWLFIRVGDMNPERVWDSTAGSILWQGGRTTFLSSGGLTFRILEQSELSTQGLVQRAGCVSLKSDKTGEAFYFALGYALVHSKLSNPIVAHNYTNSLQVVSTEGMNVGDDITIGSGGSVDSGRIIDVNAATSTIRISVNFTNNHAANEVVDTTYRSKTTLQTAVVAGATQITVQPGSGLERYDKIRIDAEEATIVSSVPAVPNTFNIFSLTALSSHPVGTLVTWKQYPNRAYANHAVAPWYGEPEFSAADSGTWQMKRVIAMTRDVTEELDGSYLTSVFTKGMVKKSGVDAAPPHARALPHGWGPDDVDQGSTGYDATGSGAEAYDKRASTHGHFLDASQLHGGESTATSKTKVEFPNLTVEVKNAATLPPHKVGEKLTGEDGNLAGRQESQDSDAATEGGNSRYFNETVNILTGEVLLFGQ